MPHQITAVYELMRWELVVCDEAHKMSATYFGGEVKYTKHYRLGQLLSTITRHFLLITATPPNGRFRITAKAAKCRSPQLEPIGQRWREARIVASIVGPFPEDAGRARR
jgi:hypothetical protein